MRALPRENKQASLESDHVGGCRSLDARSKGQSGYALFERMDEKDGRSVKTPGQPAVYKLDSEQPDTTHAELTQGKTKESDKPSS